MASCVQSLCIKHTGGGMLGERQTPRLVDERRWAEALNLSGYDCRQSDFDRTEALRLVVQQAAASAVMLDSEDLRLSRSAKRQNRGHALR